MALASTSSVMALLPSKFELPDDPLGLLRHATGDGGREEQGERHRGHAPH